MRSTVGEDNGKTESTNSRAHHAIGIVAYGSVKRIGFCRIRFGVTGCTALSSCLRMAYEIETQQNTTTVKSEKGYLRNQPNNAWLAGTGW